jgi:exodeoxyribonuclease VII large subunit
MAGKLVVPELNELLERLDRSRESVAAGVRRLVERDAGRLEHSRAALRPALVRRVEREGERLDATHERLRRAPALAVERKRAALEQAAGRLRALSPRSTLERGYAIVRRGSELVRSVAVVTPGERVDVELGDGSFGARVE